jgi:hypothetical protein
MRPNVRDEDFVSGSGGAEALLLAFVAPAPFDKLRAGSSQKCAKERGTRA